MDFELLFILLIFCCSVIIWMSSIRNTRRCQFNSAYDRQKDLSSIPDIKEPLFIVEKIESTYTSNGFKKIAKYTCYCGFLTSKNSSRNNYFVFYAPIDKYHIGEEIHLSNI